MNFSHFFYPILIPNTPHVNKKFISHVFFIIGVPMGLKVFYDIFANDITTV